MVSIVIFILVIMAFAVFGAFKLNRKYEKTLPLSCMGIILFLFLMGMLNILKVGAVLVIVTAIALYVYTFYFLIKSGLCTTVKSKCSNLFTPGFFVFLLLSVLIAYWNRDRLAMLTDEFSHWLDTVVIMARIDDFGTAPNSTAVFPSYPPAMSLFQYLIEKISIATSGEFSEWKAYYAYQLLAVVMLLPFIDVNEKAFTKRIAGVLLWTLTLITPLYFFGQAYNSLYIDPFLAIMAGSGFAYISLATNKDWLYVLHMSMLCAVLTLSKDVGIYLSLFISLYFLIDYISINYNNDRTIRMLGISLTPMISMAIAKMLWKLELTIAHTELKFAAPFDIKGTIATINGQGSEFYTKVYDNFKGAITYRYIYYEYLGFNYSAIMFLLTVAFIILHIRLYNKKRITKATAIAGAIIPSVSIICYVLSMFPLYISRFSEYEAEKLASFDRYCGIVFGTGLLLLVLLTRDMIVNSSLKKVWVICLSTLMVYSAFHSERDLLKYYTSRKSVEDSIDYRSAVNILSNKINAFTEEDARILIVGMDEDIFVHPILATVSKPRAFTYCDVHITEKVDETQSGLSEAEFEEVLVENYDYVAIYRATDNVRLSYSGIFENQSDINDLSLYKVDSKGKLTIIQ